MNRETWLWMRASVSLMAATAAAMRLAAQNAEPGENMPALPEADLGAS